MHRVKAVSILLAALLLLLIASVVFAQYSPDVLIVDQELIDGEVIVARATVNGPGWVVIYTDNNGEPGEIVGYAPLMNGINANIMVDLDPDALTDTLYAVLHEDVGFAGTFEFPGDDAPVAVDEEMVATTFQVTGSGNTIAGLIEGSEGFATLLAALQAAELLDSLRADGPFTLFAPTDAAFDALPVGALDGLLKDSEALGELLRYHVVAGQIAAEDITDGLEAETLQGMMLSFAVDGDTASVNGVDVSEANIGAVNGVIHAVNNVLMPPSEEDAAAAEAEATEAAADVEGDEAMAEEPSGMANMAAQVTTFVQSFLTLRQDEPAASEEVAEETADEEMAKEDAESDEAAAAEEMAATEDEGAEAVVEEDASDVAEAESEEVAETEEPSGITTSMASQVGAFVQSFLTLRQEDSAEPTEAVVEEVAAEEVAAEEVADEAVAEEDMAEEESAAAEAEEVAAAAAENEEAVASDEADVAEDEAVAETEEPSGITGMASQVGAFVQSVLTLGQNEPAAAAEEAAAEGTDDSAAAVEETADEGVAPLDIVDTAVAAGSFQTLAAALEAADLVDALKGEGPFTVFAPTDEAFAALPEGMLDELLQDPDTLVQVLLYHVVADKLMADDIAKIGSALTLEGDMLPFAVDGDNVMVGDASVTAADMDVANGVIHVIDQVLLPPAMAVAAAEPVVEEEAEPETPQSIAAGYQESDGSSVLLDSVISAGDGWAVIRIDDGFVPGDVLGYVAVPAGESTDVTVDLESPLTEDTMVWAVLQVDDGETGVFEYPDADQPAIYNQSIVMGPFNVAVIGDDEMAVEEEVVEEEVAEEEVAEEEVAEEEVAEEEVAMAEEETDAGEALDMSGVAEVAGAFLQNLFTLSDAEMAAEDETVVEESDAEMAAEDEAVVEESDAEMAAEDEAVVEESDAEMAAEDEAVVEESDAEMAAEDDAMAEASDEEMAAEDEAMAEASDEEMAAADDAMAEAGDEEMAAADDAMAAPDALPETGLSLSAGTATVPVVMLVLMVLVAGAFVTRRRPV